MKKKKALWVLLASLVCLFASYKLIENMQAKEEPEQEEESVYITQMDDVVHFSYTDESSKSSMGFTKKEDVWYYEEDESVSLDQSILESMVDTFANIEAIRQLEEPDALEDYGLEEPMYTITLEDADGNTVTVYVGDGAGENYYVAVDKKENVYTASDYIVSVMEFNLESLTEVEETESE